MSDLSTIFSFRPAEPGDISAINAINKHYVENTVLTFATEASSDEVMVLKFHEIKKEGLPYMVAETIGGNTEHGTIVGYAYISSFRGERPAYRHSFELSIFCHPNYVHKGIGLSMIQQLLAILRDPQEWRDWFQGTRLLDCKPRQLLAVMAVDIDMPGCGLALRDWYLKLGFKQAGHLKEVGWKKERWVDTIYLQLTL